MKDSLLPDNDEISWKKESLLQQLLANRGHTISQYEALEIFHYEDPFLLPDVDIFIERILKAKEQKERVIIYGDYDVDGISATAALFLFLKDELGITVSYRIPHRELWYGLHVESVEEIATTGTTLLITVDCGIRDIAACEKAHDHWIDVIITDHHDIPDELPSTPLALINPQLPDSAYSQAEISGSWVVLKLIHATFIHIWYTWKELEEKLDSYTDLACLGTISDCMPLVGDNRIMAARWLQQMFKSTHPCFKALLWEKRPEDIDADFVWFLVWPLINAAWRIEHPYSALKMLICRDAQVVDSHIQKLTTLNATRKEITHTYTLLAEKSIQKDDPILFFDHPEIPHGIVGIIAWRLLEKYNKPAIVLAHSEEKLVASCRSPEYLHITQCLDEVSDLLLRYGWHAGAAWFSLLSDEYQTFKERMNQIVSAAITNKDTTPEIHIDTETSEWLISLKTIENMSIMKPFGRGNEKPLFAISDVIINDKRRIGQDKTHLKVSTTSWLQGIWFWWADLYESIPEDTPITLIATLDINEWNNVRSPQVMIQDVIVDK